MRIRRSITLAVALVAALAASGGNASTVSIDPTQTSVSGSGSTSFQLSMDFTGLTIQGGGVSLKLNGPISTVLFTPSSYFSSLGFAGSGTADANSGDAFGIYFGDFAGITGAHILGDISVNVTGTGIASIALNESSQFPFEPLFGEPALNVTGGGTSVLNVSEVPAPASAWLLATGVGAIGAWRRRKSGRTEKTQAC